MRVVTFLACCCTALAMHAKESVMFVGAHPDDSEGFAATAFLLKDKYDIHVVDVTRGERGFGLRGFYDGTTGARRVAEEYDACALLGATPHFLCEKDSIAIASQESIDTLARLIRDIGPKAIFTHWPIDVHTDHAMTAAIVAGAMRQARSYPAELYYFEVLRSQTRNYKPIYSVDVSATMTNKVEMLRHYVCQNGNDKLVKQKLQQAKERGAERSPAVAYAETFTTFSGEPIKNGVLEKLQETTIIR